MRNGEHVKLNKEVTEMLLDKAAVISADKLLDLYVISYLPVISDSLASIADGLEILTKELVEKEADEELEEIVKGEINGTTHN